MARQHTLAGLEGNRILTYKHLEKILLTPAGFEAFCLEAALGSFLLLEQVESDVTQDCDVLGTISFTNSAIIFSKGNIQDPVNTVFDTPVTAYGLSKLGCLAWQAGNVTPCLLRDFVTNSSFSFDYSDGVQVGPFALGINVLDKLWL